MEEHSKDLKVWRAEFRTIEGSRIRKADPPPRAAHWSHLHNTNAKTKSTESVFHLKVFIHYRYKSCDYTDWYGINVFNTMLKRLHSITVWRRISFRTSSVVHRVINLPPVYSCTHLANDRPALWERPFWSPLTSHGRYRKHSPQNTSMDKGNVWMNQKLPKWYSRIIICVFFSLVMSLIMLQPRLPLAHIARVFRSIIAIINLFSV